jgi:hypothetical protein
MAGHATLMDVFNSATRAVSPFLEAGTEELKKRNDLQFQNELTQHEISLNTQLEQNKFKNPQDYANDLYKLSDAQINQMAAKNNSLYYQERIKELRKAAPLLIEKTVQQKQIQYNFQAAGVEYAKRQQNIMDSGEPPELQIPQMENNLKEFERLFTPGQIEQQKQEIVSGAWSQAAAQALSGVADVSGVDAALQGVNERIAKITGAPAQGAVDAKKLELEAAQKALDDAAAAGDAQAQERQKAEVQRLQAEHTALKGQKNAFFAGQKEAEAQMIAGRKKEIYQQQDDKIRGMEADFNQKILNGNVQGAAAAGKQYRAYMNNQKKNGNITGDMEYAYRNFFYDSILTQSDKSGTQSGNNAAISKVLPDIYIQKILKGEISPASGIDQMKQLRYADWLKEKGVEDNDTTRGVFAGWDVGNAQKFNDAVIKALTSDPDFKGIFESDYFRAVAAIGLEDDLKALGIDGKKNKEEAAALAIEKADALRSFAVGVLLSYKNGLSPEALKREIQDYSAGYILDKNITSFREFNNPDAFGGTETLDKKDLAARLVEMGTNIFGYKSVKGTPEYPGDRPEITQTIQDLKDVIEATTGVPWQSLQEVLPENERGLLQGIPTFVSRENPDDKFIIGVDGGNITVQRVLNRGGPVEAKMPTKFKETEKSNKWRKTPNGKMISALKEGDRLSPEVRMHFSKMDNDEYYKRINPQGAGWTIKDGR